MRQHHQRIGLADTAQDARTLRARDGHLPAAVGCTADDTALELGASGPLADGCCRARHQGHQRLAVGTRHDPECLTRESVEGDECRHRVAGQREQPGAAPAVVQRTECKGPPRAHGHLPERHLAQPCQHVAGVVGVAHADAATGQHHVRLQHGGVERGFERGGVVTHQAKVDDLDAQALQGTEQAVAVAVVNAAIWQRLAQCAQLVAGGKQRHPQAAIDLHVGDAE